MEHLIKVTALIVFAIVLVGLGAAPGWAQGTTELSGRVVDPSGAVLPGVSVLIMNEATGSTRSTVTNANGSYNFSGLQPGIYTMEVVLEGFATARFERLELRVAQPARQDIELSLGSITESVTVTGESPILNVIDSSLGNTIDQRAIADLPVEAQNVVELLSLQPGAVFIPNWETGGEDQLDPRYGAVSGARADQQNVTLDGVDVNDPEFQSSYTSAVRITQEALQEFRVSTSNYGAEYGRSSGPQVSMVTKSGGNSFRGSGYWFGRRTATSTNEYFLELAQLDSGEESVPPKLDKNIFGASVGGPIVQDRAFFYFNYERLSESSERPVVRGVPSDSFRDGVLLYECADPGLCPGGSVQGLAGSHSVPAGWYGMTPAEIAALDPLHIGPNLNAMVYFQQYPSPNEPGLDGVNIMDFRFASPIENKFNTYVGRFDAMLTESGNQNLFVRFNAQGDTINAVARFPGSPPSSQILFSNAGVAIGHDWVLSDSLLNTFRYGYTRIDQENAGQVTGNYNTFRFISSFDAITFTETRTTPLHNFVDSLTWHKGDHTVKTGVNLRFTRIPSSRDSGSYLSASANPSWVEGVGRTHMPGSARCTTPACTATPAVASGFAAGYADSWLNMIGVLSQARLRANYSTDGSQLPIGAPVERTYATNEYELFAQDSWQISPDLTLSAGLRYILYSPPYEANGLQVAPTISMGEWFNQREQFGKDGIPSTQSPLITFDLAGPVNNAKGYYEWDKNNFAPSVTLAWSPGEGDLVVRGGYYKVFDRIGMGLARNFDRGFAYGMATQISSPYGDPYEFIPGARFVDTSTMPVTMPAAPEGGFPATPPIRAGIITTSIDDTLETPYAHVVNVALAKQLGPTFMAEAAYVGRFGRQQVVRRDIAMPLNLTDPQSGASYFEAAGQMINAAYAAGLDSNSDRSEFAAIAPIPYWENLFPDAASDGLTATQAMAQNFLSYDGDWISGIWEADQYCYPACSIHGPFAYFAEQYDSLAAISTIGRSNYHALQLTARKRMSHGLQFDVNYTLAKAEDMGSEAERGSGFSEYDSGGYSGFIVNTWDPESNYGNADYDVRHQVNTNWIYELPFGSDSGVLNQVIGDWSVAGLVRWSSGFPFNVQNCRSCWATNWNLQGNAMLNNPGQLPPLGTTLDAVDGRPSPFLDPEDAKSFFRRALPGEVGARNILRGEGYFTLDLSIAKMWDVGYGRLRFRWDIFNLTNHVGFDVRGVTMNPDRSGFGRYNNTFATCDGLAGRCMQFGLRYEF